MPPLLPFTLYFSLCLSRSYIESTEPHNHFLKLLAFSFTFVQYLFHNIGTNVCQIPIIWGCNRVSRRKHLNIIKSLYLTLIHDSFSCVSSPETDSAGCPNRFRQWPANIAPVTTRCLKPRTMKSCTPVSGIFINEELDNRDPTYFNLNAHWRRQIFTRA